MKLKDLIEKYGEYDVGLIETPKGQDEWSRVHILKPKPKSVWDLEHGDKHIWVDGVGNVKECDIWSNESFDPMAREVGNIFLTREDAEKDLERRKFETLLLKYGGRRWFNGYNHNFYIGLDEYEEHLKAYILMTPTQGMIYFDTKEQAEKAVKKIGEDRIKKALFEVR